MKSILTISTLLFTMMLSSISFAEWTKVAKGSSGNIFYLDFERIRKHNGYVYWWDMVDFLKPDKYGDLSVKLYKEGDCKLFRYRPLSFSFHKEPMGYGTGDVQESQKKNWGYPPPNSMSEKILKAVCSR